MSREERLTSERLARVHVAQVHFNEGNPYREQGIADRDARMGESPGLKMMKSTLSAGALWIRSINSCSALLWYATSEVLSLGRKVGQPLFDRRQRVPAVERGFPGANRFRLGPLRKAVVPSA